jgi:hypothetical protein
MGLYINGTLVRQLSNVGDTDWIRTIPYADLGLMDIGQNLIELKDSNTTYDAHTITILREGIDTTTPVDGSSGLPDRLTWTPVGQTIKAFKESAAEVMSYAHELFDMSCHANWLNKLLFQLVPHFYQL